MTVQAWVYLVGALVAWVPLARVGSLPEPAHGADLVVVIVFSALAALVWPLVLLAGLIYGSRRQIERVFVGKPRPSRTDLERRIRDLEREVEL